MLTSELALILVNHGTRVVMVSSPEDDFLSKASRISPIINAKPVWDTVIDVYPFSTPLTASQTARALAMFDPDGNVRVCFISKDPTTEANTYMYYDIAKVSYNERTHTITIHPGDLLC